MNGALKPRHGNIRRNSHLTAVKPEGREGRTVKLIKRVSER